VTARPNESEGGRGVPALADDFAAQSGVSQLDDDDDGVGEGGVEREVDRAEEKSVWSE
jgi:hypothetical protein